MPKASIDLALVGVSTPRLARRKLLRVLLLVSRSASKGPFTFEIELFGGSMLRGEEDRSSSRLTRPQATRVWTSLASRTCFGSRVCCLARVTNLKHVRNSLAYAQRLVHVALHVLLHSGSGRAVQCKPGCARRGPQCTPGIQTKVPYLSVQNLRSCAPCSGGGAPF